MKKKKLMLAGMIICASVLGGCAANKEQSPADETKRETEIQTTETKTTEMPESAVPDSEAETTEVRESDGMSVETVPTESDSYELPAVETDSSEAGGTDMQNTESVSYPSEDAGSIRYESPLGYSCMYDPTVFVLDDTGEGDYFSYQTAETLAAPVYMSVQVYADMSAEAVADGLVLQSGIDGVEVQDTYFGASGEAAKSVYIEQEINGVKQIQTFYAIPSGTGSLLVELGGYVGMPEAAEHKLEEITGTFSFPG